MMNLNALDELHSKLERFDDERVMFIDDYSFIETKLTGVTVFKVP